MWDHNSYGFYLSVRHLLGVQQLLILYVSFFIFEVVAIEVV